MNEKDSTTGHTETEKIIKQHNEQPYAKKVDYRQKCKTHTHKNKLLEAIGKNKNALRFRYNQKYYEKKQKKT